ncbi:phospholipid scramblase 1-like [Rhinoraja longicauda]
MSGLFNVVRIICGIEIFKVREIANADNNKYAKISSTNPLPLLQVFLIPSRDKLFSTTSDPAKTINLMSLWTTLPIATFNRLNEMSSEGCPPGLEPLLQMDKIAIFQKFEPIEVILGIETINRYEIKNNLDQRVYYALEKSNVCCRLCCGSNRALKIRILDDSDTEIMCLKRSLRCQSCWCPCCLQELEVQAPPGTTIGYVVQKWSPCFPKMAVQNKNRHTVLRICGPCCQCGCCKPVHFKIKSMNKKEIIGNIAKNWSGLLLEAFTDADNFEVTFPMNLDVNIKAVLLGATFLIDFMYFET